MSFADSSHTRYAGLPGPVVSAAWLAKNIANVQVVDVGWSMENGPHRAAYLAGHIPGAVFADLDVDLSDPPGDRGRHPLPSPERFADARSRLGLVSRPVVAYDDRSGAVAGRLWWMLDAIGHPAAVLDGGIQAWTGPRDEGEGDGPGLGQAAKPVPWPQDRFIDVVDVLPAIADGSVLVDARSAERFAGMANPVDSRPGHIPGSRSRPWTDNVDDDGRLLSAEQLRAQFENLGVHEGTALIASCGSGVTGCHDLLAARVAGIGGGRLYTGSWSEWSGDPGRPVATDEPEGL